MIIYLFIYLFIWGLAGIYFINFNRGVIKYIYAFQSLVIILFVSFRFQTGYDWPVYLYHYEAVIYEDSQPLEFEFLYEVLVNFFVWLGVDFPKFSLIVSIFSTSVWAFISFRFFGSLALFINALAFSIPDFYIIPYFSLVRQVFSVGCFLLAVYMLSENYKMRAVILFSVAIGFHYSAIGALLVLFFSRYVVFDKLKILMIFFVGVIFYLFSIDLIRFFLGLGFFEYSGIYGDRDTYNASILYKLAYVIVNCIILVAYSSMSEYYNKNYIGRVLYGLGFISLVSPLYFWGFPTIATRYQFFFCIFLIGICWQWVFSLKNRNNVILIFVATFVLSFLPFYRFLTNPLSIVFIPYQSMFFFDENNSTGKDRTQELIDELMGMWGEK